MVLRESSPSALPLTEMLRDALGYDKTRHFKKNKQANEYGYIYTQLLPRKYWLK